MAEPLTVLIDEGCGICVRLGRWLARHDGILVEPIGSTTGATPLRDLSRDERYSALHAGSG